MTPITQEALAAALRVADDAEPGIFNDIAIDDEAVYPAAAAIFAALPAQHAQPNEPEIDFDNWVPPRPNFSKPGEPGNEAWRREDVAGRLRFTVQANGVISHVAGGVLEQQVATAQPDPALDVERLARALARTRRTQMSCGLFHADKYGNPVPCPDGPLNEARSVAAAYDADKGAGA